MQGKVLVLTENDSCLLEIKPDEWAKRNFSFFKTKYFEQAIHEIQCRGKDYFLIIIEADNQDGACLRYEITLLRSLTTAPITIVSKEPFETSIKVEMLYRGVDQFHVLPMPIEEAIASMFAQMRRHTDLSHISEPITIIYTHGILISVDHRSVHISGMKIDLLKKEFDLLYLLIRNPGRVLTYRQIFRELWGEEYIDNPKDLLWNHVCQLRDKI